MQKKPAAKKRAAKKPAGKKAGKSPRRGTAAKPTSKKPARKSLRLAATAIEGADVDGADVDDVDDAGSGGGGRWSPRLQGFAADGTRKDGAVLDVEEPVDYDAKEVAVMNSLYRGLEFDDYTHKPCVVKEFIFDAEHEVIACIYYFKDRGPSNVEWCAAAEFLRWKEGDYSDSSDEGAASDEGEPDDGESDKGTASESDASSDDEKDVDFVAVDSSSSSDDSDDSDAYGSDDDAAPKKNAPKTAPTKFKNLKMAPKKLKPAPKKPKPRRSMQLAMKAEIEKVLANKGNCAGEAHHDGIARRAASREVGPGPGDLVKLGAEAYAARYHSGAPPPEYIFKVKDSPNTLNPLAHVCDCVDLIADLYPEYREQILSSVVWTSRLCERRRRVERVWRAPEEGSGSASWNHYRDVLVPDHVAIRKANGRFDLYVIAMLKEEDNLSLGGIERSLRRGVPIKDP